MSDKIWLLNPFRTPNFVCFFSAVIRGWMLLTLHEIIEFNLPWWPSVPLTDLREGHPLALQGLQQLPNGGQACFALWVPVSFHWVKKGVKRMRLLAWMGEVNLPIETSPAVPVGCIRNSSIWNPRVHLWIWPFRAVFLQEPVSPDVQW